MPTKHPRLNLQVPTAIAERLREESDFLGVRSKVLVSEGEESRELKSTADLVRWAADLYIWACELGLGQQWDYEETSVVPLTLDSYTKGRWEYALKQRYAVSYHQLASFALCQYFARIDERAAADKALLAKMQSQGALRILGYLRKKDDALLSS